MNSPVLSGHRIDRIIAARPILDMNDRLSLSARRRGSIRSVEQITRSKMVFTAETIKEIALQETKSSLAHDLEFLDSDVDASKRETETKRQVVNQTLHKLRSLADETEKLAISRIRALNETLTSCASLTSKP
jgi:hypothetical protein